MYFDPLKSRNHVQEKNHQREAIDDNLVELKSCSGDFGLFLLPA